MDQICRNIKDVDGMGQITEDVDEGFSHLTAHVQICVLVLKQVDSVLNRTIRG